jgi:chemotaxis protein MotD
MTIGADMPLRSQIDARIRDSGKADPIVDVKMPVEDRTYLDFETVVKIEAPRVYCSTVDKVQDNKFEVRDDETEADGDKPSSHAPIQGMFGQTMMALEQLLVKQRQNQERSLAVVDTDYEDAARPLEVEPETASGGDASLDLALPEKVSTDKTSAMPALKAGRTPAPNQGPATAAKRPQEAEAKSQEPALEKAASRPVEPPAAPSTNPATIAQSFGGQTEARAVTTSVPTAPSAMSRPPITDIQVVADRTTGATRTLVIQLQPIELGTVTARLRLTTEGMHIQLSAEDHIAAERLARDHEALGKALKLAGVGDDTSSVTIAVIDRSSPASNVQGGQLNPGGQDQQADARANGQGQAASGGAKQGGGAGQQFPGDGRADERTDKAAKPDVENNLSRGLVV